jgi:5-methylcytosine-specific restriction endonuclease McrA
MSTSYVCRFCLRHKPLTVAGVCDQCTNDLFANDGKASIQGISKLLKLSTATLRRLESTGQLTVDRNEAGSRRYSKATIESYILKNSDQLAARLTKGKVQEVTMDEVEQLSAPFSSLCPRCNENDVFDKGYCIDCLTDLISKVDATKILGVSLPRLERILEEYPEYLQTYPYLTQLRMSRSEVESFLSKLPETKVTAGSKWSSYFRKCRLCGKTDNEHYGGGYCFECYPDTNEAKLLQGYLGGENLAEIGTRLGFSRERARQLFNKAVSIDIERLGNVTEYRKQEIRDQIELTYKQNRAAREFKHIIEENYDWGYCENCYTRSDEWKKQQYEYRTNNYEKFREHQKAYEAEYHKRPEVKERMNQKSFRKRYDGNREATIELDDFKCRDCGIDRETHKLKYGHDLSVFHLDGSLKNNDPSNLATLCKSCLAKRGTSLVNE